MSIEEIRAGAEHKMLQSIDVFKNSLSRVRTGRPNPASSMWCRLTITDPWCPCRKWPTSP